MLGQRRSGSVTSNLTPSHTFPLCAIVGDEHEARLFDYSSPNEIYPWTTAAELEAIET